LVGRFGKSALSRLERGLEVDTDVGAAWKGMKDVPVRTLSDTGGPGWPENQVRADAEQNFEVWDPELFDGEGDFRPARPTDNFPANDLLGAPDLSLMAKGRAGFHGPIGLGINQFVQGTGGAEYIASLLTGYTGEEKEEAGVILYENKAFPGGWISMAPPLWGEDVDYIDGSPTDIEHLSVDVSAFLMWAAEPQMMARKQTGFVAVLFLAVLTVLLYLTNKRIWAPVKRAAKETPAE